MSPEQARGETATSASDMYSFGLVLQELYTARAPYPESADPADALRRAQRGETAPITGVAADIRSLIERLTSPIAAQRPTALDVSERLRWIHDAPKRRARNLLIGGVAAIVVLGAIKYTVDLSRERTAAIAARDEAAQRRDQAEALIGFMLGDLRSKLQQVGRLELLEDVGNRAMAYFGAVPSRALSDEELLRRSQALRQLGELRQARADLPGALETYRESLRLAREVAGRDPDNGEWQLGLAAAHFYVGDVLRRQRDAAGALQEYVAYRDIAQRLVDRQPENETFLLELSYARNNVAAAYETQGNLEAARRELEGSLQLKEQLLQRAPENVERLQAVATAHNRLGVVLDRLGEMEPALTHLVADLEIRKRLVARDPKNRAIRRSLQVAHAFVGKAYEDRGDMDAAIEQYDAWRTVTSEQMAADPQNADWARDWARAETVMASARLLTGDRTAAEDGYLNAVKVLRPLAAKSATDAARQRDLAIADLGLGQVYGARGDHAGALRQADLVWQTLSPLERQGDREAARLSAEAGLLAARSLTATRRPADAQEVLERAAKGLAVDREPPTDKASLATFVRVLLAQDRPADAGPFIARLRAMGYRHPTFVRVTASIP
jgi:tetratricopeptide (TPR) repeat protein